MDEKYRLIKNHNARLHGKRNFILGLIFIFLWASAFTILLIRATDIQYPEIKSVSVYDAWSPESEGDELIKMDMSLEDMRWYLDTIIKNKLK